MSAWALRSLVDRDTATNTLSSNTTNSTIDDGPLQVVCAWPVSSQYGPGSRFIYYILVVACVSFRKTVWLRNTFLAVALLLPAVAAIHGIVLAAVHVDGAIDLDVYGAFQLCSIGILAAPATVRYSETYFKAPGKNIIFLWTTLVLAGLLSLVIEFYRTDLVKCVDPQGNPIGHSAFVYGNTTCGLTCSTETGPFVSTRGGSANNIYVIPGPSKLTFDTATLLAAACCIPAVLSLFAMWSKVLYDNWKKSFGQEEEPEQVDPNAATQEEMKGVNDYIKNLLTRFVELPIFGAAVLAIVVIGERNFFSYQVMYQTEPMASIGQWGPIASTVLAVAGSLYLYSVGAVQDEEPRGPERHPSSSTDNDGCSFMHGDVEHLENQMEGPLDPSLRMRSASTYKSTATNATDQSASGSVLMKGLSRVSNYFTPSREQFSDAEFKEGMARNYPELPGELQRNPRLSQIREHYNPARDETGHVTPSLRHQRSLSSIRSGVGQEDGATTPRATRSRSPHTSLSPISPPSPTLLRHHRMSSLPIGERPHELHHLASTSSAGSTENRRPLRRMTDGLQSMARRTRGRNNSSGPPTVTVNSGLSPPDIVVQGASPVPSPAPSPVPSRRGSLAEDRNPSPVTTLPPAS